MIELDEVIQTLREDNEEQGPYTGICLMVCYPNGLMRTIMSGKCPYEAVMAFITRLMSPAQMIDRPESVTVQ
jgi:hypothetical protein